ncbi:Osmoprotectant-binding protein [Actinomyces bovis]|uniref:Osmoprotectant-binding protein n=1 Tax=Actinomyces bovis TaxID=1658 RepID=A0ABY1VM22_9ACTO|nr:ABC transporter substrate-binding protein [Actinomyces bovis]SPT53060.1 Osmoprotectant-binding protein [Actinomyces bovis]VEG53002.1 Osmoprotectant-binding protein [Actinomyces israelii]
MTATPKPETLTNPAKLRSHQALAQRPKLPSRRTALLAAGALGLGPVLAACSNTDPFTAGRSTTGATTGSLTVGSAQYYSNEIIAELFAQMLENAGFKVDRQFHIGPREVFLPEVEMGKIDVMPEYGGNLLQYYDKSGTAKDAAAVHKALLGGVLPKGLTVLDAAEATDQDSYTVTRATAEQYGLSSLADLSKLGRRLKVAANAEFATRPYGPDGLKGLYNVEAEVTPVEDSGGPLTVKALTDGTVDVADIYTSSPAIKENDLVVLADPKALILPQQVTPLVNEKLPLTAASTIAKVTAQLSTEELQALNTRSTKEQLAADKIAKEWLTAKGLLA